MTSVRMSDAPHKVLVIRLSSVGDIVLASPLVRAFRRRFPECRLDFMVKEEYVELVRYNPHVSTVIPLARDAGSLGRARRDVRRTGYDLIIDIHGSLRSRYLSAGHRWVVRVNKRKLSRFALVKLKWNIYALLDGTPHVAERYLEAVAPLGVRNDGEGLDLFLPPGAHADALGLLRQAGVAEGTTAIGVCPSARHATKAWPGERFAEAAGELANRLHAAILLFGSAEDRELCDRVRKHLLGTNLSLPIANFAGTASLLQTAALMDHCSIILTNDSGLMHIAAARKRRVVAVFGSTVRELGFFPYGTPSVVVEQPGLMCRPCTHIGRPACPKGHFRCMLDIPASRVAEAASQLLQSR